MSSMEKWEEGNLFASIFAFNFSTFNFQLFDTFWALKLVLHPGPDILDGIQVRAVTRPLSCPPWRSGKKETCSLPFSLSTGKISFRAFCYISAQTKSFRQDDLKLLLQEPNTNRDTEKKISSRSDYQGGCN